MKALIYIAAGVAASLMVYVYGIIFFAVYNFVQKILPNYLGIIPGAFIATGVIMAIHATIFDRNKFNQSPPAAKFNKKDRG